MNVRYTFVMLLAICDMTGHVIGTDVAIARRLNMSVPEFQSCLAELMKPDPNSNSKEKGGRRVVHSEGERGYLLVNYVTYRDIRDEEQRREYMRNYMKERRAGRKPKNAAVNTVLTPVNTCKQKLTVLANADVAAEAPEDSLSPPKKEWLPMTLDTEAFRVKWLEFLQHVRENDKIVSGPTKRSWLIECETAGVSAAIRTLDLAIRMGWKKPVWNPDLSGATSPKPPSTPVTELTIDRQIRELKEAGKL